MAYVDRGPLYPPLLRSHREWKLTSAPLSSTISDMNVGVVNHDAGPAARSELITSLRRAHRRRRGPARWSLVDQFTLSRAASRRRRPCRAAWRLVRVRRGAYASAPDRDFGRHGIGPGWGADPATASRDWWCRPQPRPPHRPRYTGVSIVLVAHPQRSWTWMGQTVRTSACPRPICGAVGLRLATRPVPRWSPERSGQSLMPLLTRSGRDLLGGGTGPQPLP